jgi:hypothetical protein
MPILQPGKLPPLTDDQVRHGARPGETLEQARCRLEAANWACPPEPEPDSLDLDYSLSGWVGDRGLEGEPIHWEPGELGAGHPGVEVTTSYEPE